MPVVTGPGVVRLDDEDGRIAAVRRLAVLDTAPETQFDKVVGLVRTVLGVPMSSVTLIDTDRQWFKAQSGMPNNEGPRCTAFCGHTVEQDRPLVIEDARLDPRFAANPLVLGFPDIRAYAGVPLTTPDGYNVGALCAIDTSPRQFTAEQIDVLARLASMVVDELELRLIATADELTGALSRRGFFEAVDREMARCSRHARQAALVVLDVDHFKAINDTHGHPAGDAVLRELVRRCASALRPDDVIGRIGGEEFALLLPETDDEAALAAAERVRELVAGEPFAKPGGSTLRVSASFGIAPLDGGETAGEWLARADVALYAAKRGGRNRCVMASEAARAAA